jgi:hypothetical protein
VTINEKVDGILNTIKISNEVVPYYYGMPEFDDNPPPNYIIYDAYEIPLYQGDGDYSKKKYNVTVNIFTAEFNMQLLYDVECAFKFGGFIYTGGGQIGSDKVYPYTLQHYKEFIITMEVE